jgi:hypothetical protein
VLDRLDCDGSVGEVQGAGLFTGCRTNSTCELREIVRGVKDVAGLAPLVVGNEFVPVGDDVVHRTSRMAIRDAAIHAPSALPGNFFATQGQDELVVVVQAFFDGKVGPVVSFEVSKSCR